MQILLWASEIEPFPIRVTTKRMPEVKHLEDMSIAGKRAGLNSSRSNLFYEAIRIIKEMREKILKKYLKKSVLRKYGIYRSSFWTGI